MAIGRMAMPMSSRPPRPRQPTPPMRPETPGGFMDEGPLWNTLKSQLYKSEVYHVKRLVGESLIQQNRTMWAELESLRSIFTDFQEQNEERSKGARQQVELLGTQHRDLMRRQAQMLLDDLRSQASACGHALEDMVPELKDEKMRAFLEDEQLPKAGRSNSSKLDLLMATPPMTPSTRPSTASGVSERCGTPEGQMSRPGTGRPGTGRPALPLGRQLGSEELGNVAEGIIEALEAERDALTGAIGEQMELFEVEEAKRAASDRRGPSTSEVQEFVHRLQDLAVSPTLRTLSAMSGGPCQPEAPDEKAPMAIRGGSSVRRLKALIQERRREVPPQLLSLGALPEASDSPKAPGSSAKAATFDPFFDDPFA